VPTRSRALFDLRNWTGEEDPPACNLEIHPTPITFDPKTFTKDTPFLQQMAYALCLSDAFVIDAYTSEFDLFDRTPEFSYYTILTMCDIHSLPLII
jgi:hypothetical protein